MVKYEMIQSMYSRMVSCPKKERAQDVKLMNEINIKASNKFEQHNAALAESSTETFSIFDDITLPVENTYSGSFHPLTQALNEMKEIFLRLGFSFADGP